MTYLISKGVARSFMKEATHSLIFCTKMIDLNGTVAHWISGCSVMMKYFGFIILKQIVCSIFSCDRLHCNQSQEQGHYIWTTSNFCVSQYFHQEPKWNFQLYGLHWTYETFGLVICCLILFSHASFSIHCHQVIDNILIKDWYFETN